ncbi:MAG: hypothetical protein PHI12_08295 [Dehalococcoidales bacterium]|nr:hypothetical protein [Dehalococcoidales bacterium]
MGKRSREHRLAVAAGIDKPFRQLELPSELEMCCGKCHTVMPESRVTEHLLKCQPAGVICQNCKQLFTPEKFMEHYKSCMKVKF